MHVVYILSSVLSVVIQYKQNNIAVGQSVVFVISRRYNCSVQVRAELTLATEKALKMPFSREKKLLRISVEE